MPPPTKEQFDAAAAKVAASAPAGLSQEQFFQLVDKELANPALTDTQRQQMAAQPETGQPYQHEPGNTPGDHSGSSDFWAGWRKSIGDQISGPTRGPAMQDMLESAAHPQSMGDMLNLIVPSATPMARAKDAATVMSAAGRGTGKILQGGGRALETVSEAAKPASLPIALADAVGRGQFREAAMIGTAPYVGAGTGRAMQRIGARLNPARVAEVATEAPRSMPDLNVRTPRSMPDLLPPKAGPMTPRMAGKPPSLEQTLQEALQSDMSEPHGSSLPPQQTATPGGPTRQSGSFSGEESVGQAGGYDSGRPATNVSEWGNGATPESAIIPEPTGNPEFVVPGEEATYNNAASEPHTPHLQEDAMYQELMSKMGGRQSEPVGPQAGGAQSAYGTSPDAATGEIATNEPWHSGQSSDQGSHRFEAEMDDAYRRKANEEQVAMRLLGRR